MSKKTGLIIATSLVTIGLIMFVAVMATCNWDFSELSTEKYETNTYELEEKISSISLDTDTADILLAPTEGEICKIVCYENENVKHSVAVQNGTLIINVVDEREWYEYIGVNFNTPKLTVYLPETEYASLLIKGSTGDIEIPRNLKFSDIDISTSTGAVQSFASDSASIQIKTSTGSIFVENISTQALDLRVSTGEVTVRNVTCGGDINIVVSTGKTNINNTQCKNLISSGNTGDIFLKDVISAETFSINRSTGDVKFDGCDAAEISVETDTGDVTGSLLSEKIFIAQTDTGKISVPRSTIGGKCEIKTDTGDILLRVE